MPRPFQVIAKPIGPRCNLACAYCYYRDKEALYPGARDFRMGEAVLEAYVRDHIAAEARFDRPEIWFTWQGGEPTLLGVDFFRRVVAVEERYRPPGTTIRNALQTNGTRIDRAWVDFLAESRFLVGLSIDGPEDLHDRFRVDRRGAPTFRRVMAALAMLREGGVELNTLTVVHRLNAGRPGEIYRFLKDHGVAFMQFIPLVERAGDRVTPWSVPPRAYGGFLCRVFDEWVAADVGRVFVQLFDVQLALWMGGPAGLCWFAETCGQGLALEHNGDLYACDHYVDAAHRLGNILETPLAALAESPAQNRFGEDKRDTLPRLCRACEFRFACNGGCPQHRFLEAPDGEDGLNYLCAAYRRFFAHAGPSLRAMAQLVYDGRPAADIMAADRGRRPPARGRPGRNDPCPCGSGRKVKACCGRAAAPSAT